MSDSALGRLQSQEVFFLRHEIDQAILRSRVPAFGSTPDRGKCRRIVSLLDTLIEVSVAVALLFWRCSFRILARTSAIPVYRGFSLSIQAYAVIILARLGVTYKTGVLDWIY
jgi:hypothetical protein